MSTRTDYNQIAEKLNYSAIETKLSQMANQEPPKKRKKASDLLAPIAGRLKELHGKGWTYEQIAKELAGMGLPVKASTLREYLTTKRNAGAKRAAKAAPGAAPAVN
jgi:hypothetical protein